MSTLQNVTDKAVNNFANKNPGQAFDPAMIDVFITLITDLITTFRDFCGETPSGVVSMSNRPSFFQKIRLNARVRRELGWRNYRTHGRDVVESLIDTGQTLTTKEVEDLYNEV